MLAVVAAVNRRLQKHSSFTWKMEGSSSVQCWVKGKTKTSQMSSSGMAVFPLEPVGIAVGTEHQDVLFLPPHSPQHTGEQRSDQDNTASDPSAEPESVTGSGKGFSF